MNPTIRWGATVAVIVGAALIAWRSMPSEEARVRKAVEAMARAATFSGSEGNFAKLAKVETIASGFHPDAEIHVDQVLPIDAALRGRDAIKSVLMAGAPQVGSVTVDVHDVQVVLGGPGEAQVSLTASAKTGGARGDFTAQEFDLRMEKVEGKWLVRRLEAVAGFRRAVR